jgi:hypothetical protein
MSRFFHIVFIFVSFIMIVSCVDRYWPVIDKYENSLVVDGIISDEPGPYTIRLSLASKVYNPVVQKLSGAIVTVVDQLNNVEIFEESDPGSYTNTDPDFKGVIGNSYQLNIVTKNGNHYQSSFEKLQKPVEIEAVYTEPELHEEVGYNYFISGLQFYIDTKPTDEDSVYLMWKLSSTYKYDADFKARYYYTGTLKVFPNSDSLTTCFKTEKLPEIYSIDFNTLTDNKLTKYPLNYVSTEDRRLSIRYSQLTKQYRITENAFNYWNSVKEQNDQESSLYSIQPYQIRGNIINPDNADEPVMGCFIVAGVSSKRIFIDRPSTIEFNYPICTISPNDIDAVADIFHSSPEEWPLYLTYTNTYQLAYPNQDCIDCRKSGGTFDKPEFWIDSE